MKQDSQPYRVCADDDDLSFAHTCPHCPHSDDECQWDDPVEPCPHWHNRPPIPIRVTLEDVPTA